MKTKSTSTSKLTKKLQFLVEAYDSFHQKMLTLQKKRFSIFKDEQQNSSQKKSQDILAKINKLY
ncbi:hypothetical protein A2533_02505 [Candidatus Falkowbacteria bacterium RIFOXYD2_FULL_35_9]|uniref:Uncharacterized protein n=1 Tax=Candidatus Falkowbacteria bacterium RIFOXYC2_FULL_36_12 TaxID=1798002 RepID=A0A1F5T3H8_9BACT|nr:MAG: hypothetical protein A2300_02275 [Candidatus Falkowbacteria bacterium RIFOXYB2_FULL_35_7]OGF33482.1 MAG: hypothetical protein A2478_02205 [Candidatus Falkowbacteria bacterium RIFOXYC2_FULL_36_12]OGF34129.1 MAG: hypothetical protein A2223_01720 [Candidatus Falkowbacteria bacterium RIFOXYA2_FULL_35_8]OGF46848.1 MAG: hypothetical protein A2533_02505 [Candidatus Falkowbacteria bacterium RIFOXYD2_FULL_35_9]